MATPKIIADFTTQLASAIAVAGTTATLAINVDDDGVTLPDGLYYFTLDGANSNKEHISCTKTGTALTAIKTVSRQGVEVVGVVRAHRVGCSVVMTDFNSYIAYMNAIALQGAPNASTSTIGVSKLSATAADPVNPIVVGDNDTRMLTQAQKDAAAGTGTPSGSNKFVTNDTLATKASVKFGGTGADGALAISSGTTTIDLANAAILTKNYTSISITGTGKLAFINPHTNGTIIVLKSQGVVTLTSSTVPCIDVSGLGGAAGAAGSGSTNSTAGTSGRTSFMFNNIVPGAIAAYGSNGGVAPMSVVTNVKTVLAGCGGGGGGGGQYTASSDGSGGGGGASLINSGNNGLGGGGNSGGTNSAAGGRGGGALYIECGGVYTNTTATVSAAGAAGSNSSSTGSGGGGGGGGGSIIIKYNTLIGDTGTYTTTGGAGGTNNGGVHNGGAGGTGYSDVSLNTEFA